LIFYEITNYKINEIGSIGLNGCVDLTSTKIGFVYVEFKVDIEVVPNYPLKFNKVFPILSVIVMD
jgi:hypothetical protein